MNLKKCFQPKYMYQNIKKSNTGDKIKVGRMKGNISIGDNIYKISDKQLSSSALDTLNKELKKVDLNCKLIVKENTPIFISLSDNNGIHIDITSSLIPVKAINSPITKERLINQLSKTNNTPFQFKNFEIELDDGLYISSISELNELRRQAISQYESKLVSSFKRNIKNVDIPSFDNKVHYDKKISLLFNTLNTNYDYQNLHEIDKIYIPFKFFVLKEYKSILKLISQKFDTYIYMPTIIRNNYNKLIKNNIEYILSDFQIKGFVISNLGNFELLNSYKTDYEFICNYTFNIFNDLTIAELNVDTITISPELNKLDLQNISTNSNIELIVYGYTPLMNLNYCLLGKTNKCFSDCTHNCTSGKKYYLKDRLGFLFRIIPDNVDTVTTIYNSKILSILPSDFNSENLRIDILDEKLFKKLSLNISSNVTFKIMLKPPI